MKTIVISSNTAWTVYNFRKSLIHALQQQGYHIVVVAAVDEYADKLKALGCQFAPIKISVSSLNPLRDLYLLYQLYQHYRQLKPNLVLNFTIKNNIYSTLAAAHLNIPVINTITGLGTVFIKKDWKTRIARLFYRKSQKRATKVIFHNQTDLSAFVKHQLAPAAITGLIPGSGVDTQRFAPVFNTIRQNRFVFLLIARIIADKGIREYVEAARYLNNKHKNITCQLLGFLAVDNITAIKQSEVERWQQDGIITYIPATDNVVDYMAQADCIVLPSYREGLSKVLLEAASMAKPIVTTNVPGCRDIVTDRVNGLLCEPKNSQDLADKMEEMYHLTVEQRRNMGEKNRQKVMQQFDERIIIQKYSELIQQVVE